MIRGLKFTVKGSDKSGHHGHAGRPGSVGGSAPAGFGSLSAPVGGEGEEGNLKANEMLNDTLSDRSSFFGKEPWAHASNEDRASLKAQVARDLAKETGVTEEQAADFVKQWAKSSNDDDMRSLAIQKDAADEFSVEISEFTQKKLDQIEHKRQADWVPFVSPESISNLFPLQDSATQKALLRAMYNKTQSEMKARGITEVRVYRGVGLESIEGMEIGQSVLVKTNALSSWSLSQKTASGFAQWPERKQVGVVFSSVVPVSRILSLPTTGFGCLMEGELLVLGGKSDRAGVTEIW